MWGSQACTSDSPTVTAKRWSWRPKKLGALVKKTSAPNMSCFVWWTQPDCSAAKILLILNVDPESTALEVEKHASGSSGPAGVGTQPSQRAKVVLDLAIEEADSLGHRFVDTGHLLLGLIREQDSLAGRILRGSGILPDVVRKQIAEHSSS